MYEINDLVRRQPFNKVQIRKLAQTASFEILSISLEKGKEFPEHVSPANAHLIVMEGAILFHINNETFPLAAQQHFTFPKEIPHWVEALEDSKFLIIR